MENLLIILIIITVTVILFLAMRRLYMRFSVAFLHPVLTTTTLICIFLVNFNFSYDEYMLGGVWIEKLLGPCVVALAYPLYNQRAIVLRFWKAIILSVVTGIISAMGSVILFAKIFNINNELIFTMLPKSITTPVAIQLSDTIGGSPSMTAVFVMIAGFSGIIIGPLVLKLTGVRSPLGRGLALGSAAHALGVAKSTEYGEFALSMASVSMTLSAILGSIIGPVLLLLL